MSSPAAPTPPTIPAMSDAPRRGWATIAALAMALAFVAIATFGIVRSNSQRADVAQREQTQAVVTALEDRLVAYEEVLYGVRGGFTVAGELSHVAFRSLIDEAQVDDRLPGVQVVGSAHYVQADEVEAYTARIDAQASAADLGYPEFRVYPPSTADEFLVIDHIEPQVGNERAFGLDFLSEPNRRSAAFGARDTGRSAATAPVTLVQETATQRAFLLMLPLYDEGTPTGNVDDRRDAFTGVVYAAFRMDDLVAGAIGSSETRRVTIVDVEANELLSGDPETAEDTTAGPTVGEMDVSGRTWRVIVDTGTSPLSIVERALPFGVALVGLLMIGLLAELARLVRTTRARSIELAEEMTKELVEAERHSSETSNMLMSILEAATEMSIIATDVDGVVTVFNAGAEQMLGYEADNVVGRVRLTHFHDFQELSEEVAESGGDHLSVIVGAARDGSADTRSWTYVRKDASRLPVELTVAPRSDGDGEICGFIAVAVDATQRLRAAAQQQALLSKEREMVAKLTEIDRVKSDFVSTMSHELRTPLTSIIGYTELLEDDGIQDPTHERMITAVNKNAHRLLVLVEDLLTLSQVESAQAALDTEDCDLARIIEAVEVTTAPLSQTNGVKVAVRIQKPLPVSGNAVELERVVLNLVTNAIKFSHRGGLVMVWARVSGGGDKVKVRVTDRGIGIAEDELPRLFTRFFRSRKAQENVIPGTGLGLSIVASIVERHHGTIEVESVENRGTTVTLTLPARLSSVVESPSNQPLEVMA